MASLLQIPKLNKEIILSLGLDTLNFNTMHQSPASLVNPPTKPRVCVFLFFFLFPFLFPMRLMNKILHFLNIFDGMEVNYSLVCKRGT